MKAFDEAILYPYHNLHEPGKSVGRLAVQLKDNIETPYANNFMEYFLGKLWMSTKRRQEIVSKSEKLFNNFYNMVVGDALEQWKSFIANTVSAVNSFASISLFNFVANSVLLQTIADSNQSDQESLDIERMKLTKSEEESLYYVSGYIVFSLKKNIKNKLSTNGKSIISLMNSWGCKGDNDFADISIEQYTRAWLEQVNRGGLFQVNQNFYHFIVNIEKVARTLLNLTLFSTYSGENIKEVLKKKFKASSSIRARWNNLTSAFANEDLKSKLFNALINK